MRFLCVIQAWIGAFVFSGALVWAQVSPPVSAPAPLVLAGGTVVDVSNWGHSAKDLKDSIVLLNEGKVAVVGTRADTPIPQGARIIDCTGKYLIPGLVDGFAGMNSQGQANAFLYMGVTTVVVSGDVRRGHIDIAANPRPHLYLLDSIGSTDDWSLLINQPAWTARLREVTRPVELSPEDTARQLTDTARLGTRVLWLGGNLTAANSQWIITHAHQMGLVTYGEFVSTPFRVAVEAGVDALLHMGRYELGVIPDELQRPLVDDPNGSAATTAFDYAQHLPSTDPHLRTYGHFLATHHAALMPTFSIYFLNLPGHRNLWYEPAASLLDRADMWQPPNRVTGERDYALSQWTRHLPVGAQRWMEDSQRKKADQVAMRLWQINETIFAEYPHYLAASGASVEGTMPGISMHTELEMLVRLGLSPREALAAATNNYALQFGWMELGQIAPGRRADILILDSDPTANIWNVRRLSTLIMDGNIVDRDALLKPRK